MSGVTIATTLLRRNRDFLNLSFHMFPCNEILEVFKVKSDLISEISTQKYSVYQISAKSVKGFGSYEYLKFRPMRPLKYRFYNVRVT